MPIYSTISLNEEKITSKEEIAVRNIIAGTGFPLLFCFPSTLNKVKSLPIYSATRGPAIIMALNPDSSAKEKIPLTINEALFPSTFCITTLPTSICPSSS